MTEASLKTIEGQIASIDPAKRIMALEDRDGIIFYSVSWLQNNDQKLAKLKVGYYVKPTVEVKSESSGRLLDMPYSERPADWPKKGSGWKGGKPRNERLIVLQSSLKVAADLFQVCHAPDTQGYDEACDLVVEKAIEMTDKIMKNGGS